MMKDKDTKDEQKLTGDTLEDHTANMEFAEASSTEHDPRIVELVRFLARAAAEKDYANLIEKSRLKSGRGKETIQ